MPGAAPGAADTSAATGEGLTGPLSPTEFDLMMALLGPFGPAPRLVAGVSGGPHSLALALLAHDWTARRGGRLLAATCDHGLRPESGAEAAGVAKMLRRRGIPSRVLRLGVTPGPGAQERARAARLHALRMVCAAEGAPWLLLGHHRGDQAETVLLRALAGSGEAGLAGMAPARAVAEALVLRPLLGVPAARLEAVVASAGLVPVRDPSNLDPRFTRIRLRAAIGAGEAALAEAAGRFAARRARREEEVAARLAGAAALHPEGFARLDLAALGRDQVGVAALRSLVRTVSGSTYPPGADAAGRLLERGAGTLGGAVLRRDGLLLREASAIGAPLPARQGTSWDGRFRLVGQGDAGCAIGALGADAVQVPRPAWLPDAVARTLPAIRREKVLVAVPALAYPHPDVVHVFRLRFAPGAGPAS
jgi:tRNA(Ile)-lysidine synthase